MGTTNHHFATATLSGQIIQGHPGQQGVLFIAIRSPSEPSISVAAWAALTSIQQPVPEPGPMELLPLPGVSPLLVDCEAWVPVFCGYFQHACSFSVSCSSARITCDTPRPGSSLLRTGMLGSYGGSCRPFPDIWKGPREKHPQSQVWHPLHPPQWSLLQDCHNLFEISMPPPCHFIFWCTPSGMPLDSVSIMHMPNCLFAVKAVRPLECSGLFSVSYFQFICN